MGDLSARMEAVSNVPAGPDSCSEGRENMPQNTDSSFMIIERWTYIHETRQAVSVERYEDLP